MLVFYFIFAPAAFMVNVLPSFFYFFFSLQKSSCNSFFFSLLSFFFEVNFTNFFFLIALIFFFLFFYKDSFFFWWAVVLNFSLNNFLGFFKDTLSGGVSLWNGALFVHPVVTILAFFFFLNFFLLVYFKVSVFKDFFFFKYLYLRFFFLYAVSSTTLGAWWAQQELNWGGWWGWDPIEVGSIFFFFFSIFFLHVHFCEKNFANFFIFFIFFIFGVRFNFFSSVHSFIFADISFNGFFFMLLCIFFLVLLGFLGARRQYCGRCYLVFLLILFSSYFSSYFFIFLCSLFFFFVFFQRVNVLFLPAPLVFFPVFFLKKRVWSHLGYFCVVLYIFFYKSTFFFLTDVANCEDFFFVIADDYFFRFFIISNKFFLNNFYCLCIAGLSAIWFEPVTSAIFSIETIATEFLQQSLLVYNFFFFSYITAFCFISLLLSFNFFFFLCFLKK